MAKKHRRPAPPPEVIAASAVDPDVARFATYMHDDATRARNAKRAAREARRKAETMQALQAAKDAAAAEIKRLRGRDGVSVEQRAAADAAYKAALAALVAAETGSTPSWAPPEAAAEGAEPTEGSHATLDSDAAPASGATDGDQATEAMTVADDHGARGDG